MKRVLLADDSVAARRSVQTMLEMAGIEVIAVGNGDLALARIDEVTPHIVLLDAIMPGRSGYEICAELKADASRAAIPVLLLTTEFEPFDERAAAAAGADGHLIKPLNAQAIARMREVFARYAPGDAGLLAEVTVAGDAAEPAPEGSGDGEPGGDAAVPAPESFITSTMKAPELPPEEDGPGAERGELSRSVAAAARNGTAPELPAELAVEVAESAAGPRAARAPTTDNLELDTPEYLEAWERAEVEARMRSVEISDLRVVGQRCPSCGASVAGGDIFCLSCGAVVLVTPEEAERIERTSYCSACRQELMPGEVFCLGCGATV